MAPDGSARAKARLAVRAGFGPTVRLPGFPPAPRPAGVWVAVVVMAPVWMLVVFLGIGVGSNLVVVEPSREVARSGEAVVRTCERSRALETRFTCIADVVWDDGTSSSGVQMLLTRRRDGDVRVNQYLPSSDSPAGEVRPAGARDTPAWTAILLMAFVFLPGTLLAARWGLLAGSRLFPDRGAPPRGRRDSPQGMIVHPDSPYQVHAAPEARTGRSLPPGHGGVVVRARSGARRAVRAPHPVSPVIGVDDRPALFGWGTALVVVPAGRRRFQVQTSTPVAERRVDVPAGEVVELDYAASRTGWLPGVLGPAGVRRPGAGRMFAPAYLVWLALQWAAHWYGIPLEAGWVLFAAGPVTYLGVLASGRLSDRRTRRQAGGGSAAVPEGWGTVALACSFRIASRDAGPVDPPDWVAAPVLRIDGREVPARWLVGRYPLPPGTHEIEFTAPVPARTRINIEAGETRRLGYEVNLDGGSRSAAVVLGGHGGPSRVPQMRTHPESPYDVWTSDVGTRGLPHGFGGLVIETWFRRRTRFRRLGIRLAQRPMVGIDGFPAVLGWGTAQVVVPAGRHLVQVQTTRPEVERAVDVPAGGTVELEYAAPRRIGWSRGLLGAPSLRQPGMPYFTAAALILLGWLTLYIVAVSRGVTGWWEPPLNATWCPVLTVGLTVLAVAKRRHDCLARARVQGPPARPPGSGPQQSRRAPHLVGPRTPPDPPDGCGSVVLTFSFQRDMYQNEDDFVFLEDGPLVWLPSPVLRIDGQDVPAGWSTWWYPLTSGSHTVEVVEPGRAAFDIDVTAGEPQYVHYHADIRVKVDTARGAVVDTQVRATLVRDRGRAGRAKATSVRHLHASPGRRRLWIVAHYDTRTYVE